MANRDATPLSERQIVTGPSFNEPMLVETVRENGSGVWDVGMVGQRSEQFRRVTLTDAEIADLAISDSVPSYSGDGRRLRLALQAYSLGIAYEFDPYFALSISHVDPLPHQLEAVYDHLLKLPSVRFLLADDAGAGKTIMAGLLIRELKMRGLVERVLVVCPANLSFQWQRELKEKFNEQFQVLKGSDIRGQFGANRWMEQRQVITSLDFAKRDDILPGLQQAHWDLVVVDEAHRMSARSDSHKSQRYRLGELLRDTSDRMLLLTATPHNGDPHVFTRFLQLLDQDAYGDVKSIREAMNRRRAPFYLRRTKEAMVHFPERNADGTWAAKAVFTERVTRTAGFAIDGPEHELYLRVTSFVKRQSRRAGDEGGTPRARAIRFLMSLYQRRLASSTHAMRRSLENRATRLQKNLDHAIDVVQGLPSSLPSWEDLDDLEDDDRERMEEMLEAVTLANNEHSVRDEITELLQVAEQAKAVENSGTEAKLQQLRQIMRAEGFFDRPDQRLLLFTEFKDTLDFLFERLSEWGFQVGCIHGRMKPGARDEPGTRLYTEQQFRDGRIQVLVATEAAGEGINLQCCHILFNYDIPWNPNRLEQRMGRIHRYGQRHTCLIFNFVATNTIEGHVLQRLLDKLQEIRDALDDDAVFNVVGEVLPATKIERVLRDYYAGHLGESDLEERILQDVDEGHFRAICQTALEGLATKNLNLDLLVEQRAKAQERRVVPETISRFIVEAARDASLDMKPVRHLTHTFRPGKTPSCLKRYDRDSDWRLANVAARYPRLSTDRKTAETNNFEWLTPGHPLFEALRRHSYDLGVDAITTGACFHSLAHDHPARLDFYRARAVDGVGKIVHERLFALELSTDSAPRLRDPGVLADMTPAATPDVLPDVALQADESAWLNERALVPFVDDVRLERQMEVDRISEHVSLSLTAILQRIDEDIGRAAEEVDSGVTGAEGRLALAQQRYSDAMARRNTRRKEHERQRTVTLQGVEKLASALILPHSPDDLRHVAPMRPHPKTEMTAMQVVMDHETAQGRKIVDVHEQNLGYDITSLDPESGDLRLIEIKGLAGPSGSILLTPNERRVADDRRDCYWLYVVVNCATIPELLWPISDPGRFPWHEVTAVKHYTMDVTAMTRPMPHGDSDAIVTHGVDSPS